MASDSIIYTYLPSPMGDMIAGATERGVCLLEWHDRGGVPRILERVKKRYGTTPIEDNSGNPHLRLLTDELASYFAGDLQGFNVPVDVIGTPFQRTVWDELQRIPYGRTRSYGDMARALGKPGAMRAVGRANGSNYLAIVIPCHRVIESSGGLGGYGGKIWRKKKLLALEGATADDSMSPQPDLFSKR